MKKKPSGNPVLQGRVSKEYKARFDIVAKRPSDRVPKAEGTDLMRVLLLAETRFDITDEERAYLRGELSALGSGEPQDGPDIILSQSGKRLGHSRRSWEVEHVALDRADRVDHPAPLTADARRLVGGIAGMFRAGAGDYVFDSLYGFEDIR